MNVLKADFMPEDLFPILQEHDFDGSIVVQADQSDEETLFQLENAERFPFIKAVVGWVNLQDEALEDRLSDYGRYPKLKGFRHILQGELNKALMLEKPFKNGIKQLNRFGYTYDLLLKPDQLGYAKKLVSEFPDQLFVLNHMGKPDIKHKNIKDWSAAVRALAYHENVCCKASGMVTEADLENWEEADFKPYLDVLFDAFGVSRILYGSDWPVCGLAANYGQVIEVMKNYTSSFSKNEEALFWGGNAEKFYKLNT